MPSNPVPPLLDTAALERSAVVANNAMNRDRGLSGVNSYARDLGFDPYERLAERLRADPDAAVTWIDICCGSGRALLAAEQRFAAEFPTADITLVGLDLVDHFRAAPATPRLRLITANATDWQPSGAADLITCVHGLHYIGDKLALLAAMTRSLTPTGTLAAQFDPALIRHPDGTPATRKVLAELRKSDFTYDARHHRLTAGASRPARFSATYLGADDTTGPGYTGQPAVASYYRWEGSH
ncbi:class I SAM-dependent methyltransferase [Nocardia sp. NPDC005978]|uniref:class I SAM-dependent methyltransferase n=1 Tax=Nocardia sp. NPDC005978 TaxID=3156725 RepID=UPI0033A36A9A